MLNRLSIICLVFTFITLGCKKKEIGPQCPGCENTVVAQTSDILVGCEGNFGWGNASITLYDPNEKIATPNLFQIVNSFGPGDVLQSFTSYKDVLFIVMNNSAKILMVDTSNYTYKGEITGFSSPRYLVIDTTTEIGYCSDLYSNQIYQLDLTSGTITGSINCGRWTEHLLIKDHHLYASCPDTNWVLKFNLNQLSDIDTIITSQSPSGIEIDNNGDLWILSSGGYQQALPSLIKYDGQSIVQTLTFGSISESPSQLKYDAKKDLIYYLNSGLYCFDPNQMALPTQPVLNPAGNIFYGLGIDPNNSEIYISDAVDYIQPGKVYRLDSTYTPVDTFQTGIIPQSFWFK